MKSYCSKTLIRAQNAPVILTVKFIYYLSQINVLLTYTGQSIQYPVSTNREYLGLPDPTEQVSAPLLYLKTKEDPSFQT
jgi:hypothetical protein